MSLCYAASFAPGWVIATSWQLTIIVSPVMLLLMGNRVPLKCFAFVGLILIGILMVNFDHFSEFSDKLVWAIIPVVIAACCYPFGNNLCGFAKNGGHKLIPRINDPVMDNTFCRVWLMTVGAAPIFFAAGISTNPPAPTSGQLISTLYVAASTGVIATSVFLYARHGAKSPFEIAAVDATQAGEVPFAFLLELTLFNGNSPKIIGLVGLVLVVTGIILFSLSKPNEIKPIPERSYQNS